MICIPRAIRPHKNYPVKLNETDILAYSFIRETEENFYIQEDLDINDFIRKIVPANTSKTDIFEYSVYLYGYYNEKHVGIRNKSFSFPLFFKANKLYNMPIIYDDESYLLSFSHVPEKCNYWHFQLYTVDSAQNRIPRNTRKPKDRKLAEFVFRQFIKKAICQKSEAIPFKHRDFDKVIKPLCYFFNCYRKQS